MSNVNFAHLSWKVPHINLFSFLQESTESANTTIEDEDLKGKVRCLLASLVSVCRSAVGYCCLSSVCQSHPLLLNNTYALPCLFPPPVLPVAEHSILPFPPYLVYLLSSGCLFQYFLWSVLFEMCSFSFVHAPAVSSSHWFNVQPDDSETTALIQSGNPWATRKTPSPSRRPSPRCSVSP